MIPGTLSRHPPGTTSVTYSFNGTMEYHSFYSKSFHEDSAGQPLTVVLCNQSEKRPLAGTNITYAFSASSGFEIFLLNASESHVLESCMNQTFNGSAFLGQFSRASYFCLYYEPGATGGKTAGMSSQRVLGDQGNYTVFLVNTGNASNDVNISLVLELTNGSSC
ncbi:MAG: hypothetical protein M1533_00235 [Candidatus Thermoplasmatota archaeon]|nr:hypothetical protein [Candidatus Thermoplasmatota archaeon]MCL5794046.1 hypothetical protein [Candidatus Thermoplasmatota archaeon]